MKLSFVFTDLEESNDFDKEIQKMWRERDGVISFEATGKTGVRGEYITSCKCDDEKSEEIQQIAARFNGKELPEERREARCDLYMGVKDAYVISLKNSLASLDYYKPNIIFHNDYFDEPLENALKAFQQDYGFPPTGVVNSETQQQIAEALWKKGL